MQRRKIVKKYIVWELQHLEIVKIKSVFIKLAKEKANINVDIISGEKESNLGFMGVLQGLENTRRYTSD